MKKILASLKLFSKKVVSFQTMIILTLVYVVALPIFSIIFHAVKQKDNKKTTWVSWNPSGNTIKDLKRQF